MVRIFAAIVLISLPAFAAPFESLYFFGDSLTDTGNVYRATSVLRTYTLGAVPRHPSAPYYNGRFSDGPVWAEHVAEQLGHPEDAQAGGMSLGWFGRIGGAGNNYAVGGARTGYGGALGLLDFAVPTGMFQQVSYYLDRTGSGADPEGLYFLFGGGNDLRDAAAIGDPGRRQAAASGAAYNVALSAYWLYQAGARQFFVINAPNVGQIPESVADGRTETGQQASVAFNATLATYGSILEMLPGINVQYFDLFSLHEAVVADTQAGGAVYGFSSLGPCRDAPTCEGSVFFDSIHPTARVHRLIAERISDQLLGTGSVMLSSQSSGPVSETPEPSTAVLTLSAVAALVLVRRRTGKWTDPQF
jgi:outer membrane lipase/esterase